MRFEHVLLQARTASLLGGRLCGANCWIFCKRGNLFIILLSPLQVESLQIALKATCTCNRLRVGRADAYALNRHGVLLAHLLSDAQIDVPQVRHVCRQGSLCEEVHERTRPDEAAQLGVGQRLQIRRRPVLRLRPHLMHASLRLCPPDGAPPTEVARLFGAELGRVRLRHLRLESGLGLGLGLGRGRLGLGLASGSVTCGPSVCPTRQWTKWQCRATSCRQAGHHSSRGSAASKMCSHTQHQCDRSALIFSAASSGSASSSAVGYLARAGVGS